MVTKLTLSAEDDVIKEAKRLAEEQNTSVSAMFARIIRGMARRRKSTAGLSPITREVAGIARLPRGKTPRDVLTDALMDKHGLKR
ncbi:MAG: hypothetical protein JXQ73_28320 [Phycisphaerae bacterium]|nr:hypothetical protein [Phycisphaerae bacterium]